jgi:hypothetical protein
MRLRTLVGAGLGVCLCLPLASTVSIAQTPPAPGAPAAASGPSPEVAKLLALPVSTGSIALLVEHGDSPDVQQRLRDALKDTRREIRTVAARVIFADGVRGLVTDLRVSLKAEQDPQAGAEEIRAIMTFLPAYNECVDAAIRLGQPAVGTVIETFARLNSPELLTFLPRLMAARPGEALADALVVVGEGNPSARDRILQEAAKHAPILDATLAASRERGDHAPAELLLSLLNSDRDDLRMVTVWHLARVVAAGDANALTPEITAALDPMFARSVSPVTWEALGLELLARAAHRQKHERQWTELAHDSLRRLRWRAASDETLLLPLLSDSEKEDLGDALFSNRDLWKHADRKAPTFGAPIIGPPVTKEMKDLGVRTVPPFINGLWHDVLTLTQCEAKAGRMILAQADYRPDGRMLRVLTGKTDAPDTCVRAARVLFSLTLAPEHKPAKPEPEVLVLTLEPEHVACADDQVGWTRTAGGPVGVSRRGGAGVVTPPTRTKDVKPVYPAVSVQKRLQGTVLIEAVISRTGCVVSGTVKRSPAPELSGAALFAVMGWQYTPSRLNDEPVPVFMMVDVNFQLR